jgi:hypothetical protein
MKRRTLLPAAGLTGLAVAGVAFTLWVRAPQSRINEAASNAIRFGMHESEVEALVGVAAGDYRTGRVEYGLPTIRSTTPTSIRNLGEGPIVVKVWPKTSEWHGTTGPSRSRLSRTGGWRRKATVQVSLAWVATSCRCSL